MKKVFFALAAVLMLSLTSQAQVKFGAKAGLNLSMLTEDDWGMKPGFHGGVYAQVKLHPMFSIQPEVLYSMQGGKYANLIAFPIQEIKVDYSVTSHNVVVPIMLQFTPIKSLTIEAGPQFGFNVGMQSCLKTTWTGLINNEDKIEGTFESDDYNMFDFSLAAGLKYNVNSNINVYARYVFGLTPVFKYGQYIKEGGYELVDLENETMNQNLMLGVGFSF